MDQSGSNQRVVLAALLFFRPKRSWKPVAWALAISVFLEIATWQLGMTGDKSLFMAVANGGLIWLSLSLLFWLGKEVSYHVFYRWLGIGILGSFNVSRTWDILTLVFSGLVMENILHLTDTATPASWGWYVLFGMLHCIHAGQLRKNVKR